MKETLFISHANPEDNYFASWLATKLIGFGYQAWVDVDDFKAGDAFFTTIQPIIKDESIRFIAVNSEGYIRKSKDQNTGVARELNTAITVRDIDKFIIPIRIDDSDYNDFPAHYASWNAVDFNENWQDGLMDLVDQLEKMNIPRTENLDDPTENWLKTIKSENKVIDKEEKCYSNWFPFELPEVIHVHNVGSSDKDALSEFPYPYTLEANRLITFADENTVEPYFSLISSSSLKTDSFLSSDELLIDETFTLIEPKKKLIRLLNGCFKKHLIKQDLNYWRKRDLNYFPKLEKSVSLKKRFGKSSRALSGIKSVTIKRKARKINWHFAISASADIYPFPHYKLYYTLVFTNENDRFLGKKENQNLRRSVPADWYNRKWFEILLASVLKISESEESEYIELEISDDTYLNVSNLPVGGTISKGYIEP